MTRDISVELQNVDKIYDVAKVVDGVNLSINKGEVLVLIGPSGCGKTTTLKMINQLIPHTSGKILVNGEDVTKLDPVELRRSIGYVIQYIGLLPHLTIEENITFVLQLTKRPRKEQHEKALELVEKVGLPEEFLKRFPRELSGGQQQRVGVARALAGDPAILLMDEPFGAVDPLTREQLQNELLRLQEAIQKTIVFVTHDMQEAFKIGNRIGIMKEGKLVAMGSSMEIIKTEDEFVQNFIGRGALFDVLDNIPVTRVLKKDVPTVREGDFLNRNADLNGWENVFVLDNKGVCHGYVPLENLDSSGKITSDKLLSLSGSCPPDLSIKKAVEEMLYGGRTWIPVADSNDIFQGIVTFDSCANLLSEEGGK